MGKMVFIVGGSRSGKSDYAQHCAESIEGERFFLATCPRDNGADREMAKRVVQHQEKRVGKGWKTIEEEVDLVGRMESVPTDATLLIDCLTLWLNNLLFLDTDSSLDELGAGERSRELAALCKKRQGATFIVSSEVGSGIVPENELARLYRDMVGRCNQELARVADKVVLVSCGIPSIVKDE